MQINNRHIQLFQTLFKGRREIYAKRWENDGRSGYMPAYDVDWETYEKHKAQGGTFQNFKDKTPAEFTANVLERHLTGKETVGIYPLLKDNTSWFLAADFDGKNWLDDSRRFLEFCDQHKIPGYLEDIERVNPSHLNQVYNSITDGSHKSLETNTQVDGGFEITLDRQMWLNRRTLPPEVIKYIREELNLINADYLMKKKMGRSTWKTERYFKQKGEQITVAMIQSLNQNEESDQILKSFGTIIVDECHHIPAKTFRESIIRFSSYNLYGITATPMRKNNDEELIYVYIGNILSEIKAGFLARVLTSTGSILFSWSTHFHLKGS